MPVRPASSPSRGASRAPARPASASATAVSISASGGVRRAYRTVRPPALLAANVVTGQSGAGQKNRRTVSRITTGLPPIAASASRR